MRVSASPGPEAAAHELPPLKIFETVRFEEILEAWALHEFRGRHHARLPASMRDLAVDAERFVALQLLFKARPAVLAPIVAAGIIQCYRVRIRPTDLGRLRIMGQDPVTTWSRNKLAEKSTAEDRSADWVRQQAAAAERIAGPMVALARDLSGALTFFDGMHRLAAWVSHLAEGREYDLEDVYVICTSRPAPQWELPSA